MTATTKTSRKRREPMVIEEIGKSDAYYKHRDLLEGLEIQASSFGEPPGFAGDCAPVPRFVRLAARGKRELAKRLDGTKTPLLDLAMGCFYFQAVRIGPKPSKSTLAYDRYDQS